MYGFDGFRLTPRASCHTLKYKVQVLEVFKFRLIPRAPCHTPSHLIFLASIFL